VKRQQLEQEEKQQQQQQQQRKQQLQQEASALARRLQQVQAALGSGSGARPHSDEDLNTEVRPLPPAVQRWKSCEA
jgi:hypothetical protein